MDLKYQHETRFDAITAFARIEDSDVGVVSLLPIGCIGMLLLAIEGVYPQMLNCAAGMILAHSMGFWVVDTLTFAFALEIRMGIAHFNW